MLTGGFPCQPFSVAGKRLGAKDDRYLWPHMLRAICEIQPTWIVCENVVGIISMVQPGKDIKMARSSYIFEESYIYRKEQQFTIESICENLESAGYSVQPFVIPACAVGAPHRRDRVWIIAHRTNARSESVQQGRKDRISEFGVVAHAKGARSARELFGKQEQIQSDRQNCRIDKSDFRCFPTQSPICNRDDGLSFRMADLTISFAKWRRKSIEALGNAWVPQVAYEIFKAIVNYDKMHKI